MRPLLGEAKRELLAMQSHVVSWCATLPTQQIFRALQHCLLLPYLLPLHHLTQLFARVALASRMPWLNTLHFLRIWQNECCLVMNLKVSIHVILREFYMIVWYTLNSSYAEKTSWSAWTWSIWDGRFFFWLSGIPKIDVSVFSSKGQDPLRQTT